MDSTLGQPIPILLQENQDKTTDTIFEEKRAQRNKVCLVMWKNSYESRKMLIYMERIGFIIGRVPFQPEIIVVELSLFLWNKIEDNFEVENNTKQC